MSSILKKMSTLFDGGKKFDMKDLEEIAKDTGYDEVTIKQFWRNFESLCPNGRISSEEIAVFLEIDESKKSTFLECLNKESDGKTSFTFKEFMLLRPPDLAARLL